MHARELIELAALVASHSHEFINGHYEISKNDETSKNGIQQYWTASKCRLDRWSHSLKKQTGLIQTAPNARSTAHWQRVLPVLEEILTGDVLTRVWTGVACAYDSRHGTDNLEPIVRSVFIGHLEARHRALNLMVYGQGFKVEQAVALNRLRRRSERWTDMLLGSLMETYDVSEFAFDKQRLQDFSGDFFKQPNTKVHGDSWSMVVSSLRAAFQHSLSPLGPNLDLNEKIAGGILDCLDSKVFESSGLMKTTWLVRLDQTTSDAQELIDQLLFDTGTQTL